MDYTVPLGAIVTLGLWRRPCPNSQRRNTTSATGNPAITDVVPDLFRRVLGELAGRMAAMPEGLASELGERGAALAAYPQMPNIGPSQRDAAEGVPPRCRGRMNGESW